MAKALRANARRAGSRQRYGNIGSVFTGLLCGLGLSLAATAAYLYFGGLPLTATDKAPLWEPLLSVPLESRARSQAKPAPFPASEEVFESGAHIYRSQCSQCHGVPGQQALLGRAMSPHAQQFFAPRERRGAASQPTGEFFWKTAFGIRRSGMPAYNHLLTNTQLWQVSLLLHGAGEELPDPVRNILTAGIPPPQPTTVQP